MTFDLDTIPRFLSELAASGTDHSGIIFISSKTFRSYDVGGLVQALERTLRLELPNDMMNHVIFLRP